MNSLSHGFEVVKLDGDGNMVRYREKSVFLTHAEAVDFINCLDLSDYMGVIVLSIREIWTNKQIGQ